MKSSIILVLTVAVVAVFAIHRQDRLAELKEETLRLERQSPEAQSKRHRTKLIPEQADAPAAQVEFVRESLVELFVLRRNRSEEPDPEHAELMKRLFLAAKDLSARDMESVINALSTDSRFAGMEREGIIEACYSIFGRTAPFAWREYLISHRDLPHWQNLFETANSKCMRDDAKRALELIEQETALGNPEVATSDIRSSVLLALADSNPDKMLALAVSPELAADPDALAHLGGFVDDRLENPADHQRFLAALRRAQQKNPSPVLDKIREDYVREMCNQLPRWPFEEMKLLVEGELSKNEKLLIAEKASHLSDLDEKGKWANWFLGIDPDEWDAWIKTQPQKFRHPAIGLMNVWAREDIAASETWLEKMPLGDLRNATALEFAWTITDRDPDRAAGYLDQLPASKGKENLLRKIEKSREKGGARGKPSF